MDVFLGVCRYEYWMSIKRVGLIVTVILLSAFMLFGLSSRQESTDWDNWSWSTAASMAFLQAIFFPVVAGIFAADRAKRDEKLGVMELLQVTGLKNRTYILGKHMGVALSMLTLSTIIGLLIGVVLYFYGAPPLFPLKCLVATWVIIAPAIFFVTAFSLVCPLIMPVRVYQILFTGYWYWGNFVNPDFIPSISDTLLNASGRIAWQGIFGGTISGRPAVPAIDVALNILLLTVMAAGALITMELFLRRQQAKM